MRTDFLLGAHVNMHTNRWLTIALLGTVLSGCGGGGDASGDVTTFSVNPTARTYGTVCPEGGGGGVVDQISEHTIIGGRQPFRVRSTDEGLEVGLFTSGVFVPAPPDRDLILEGQDPEFAIRTTLPCGSDVTVLVLDLQSRNASVSIKVEAAD